MCVSDEARFLGAPLSIGKNENNLERKRIDREVSTSKNFQMVPGRLKLAAMSGRVFKKCPKTKRDEVRPLNREPVTE
jgi:hypothetical protein